VIRSTFITGFPGETEDDFQQLMNFIDEAELDRVGCFTYSAVDGATANALPDHVPDEVKEERRARLMERQADISADRLAARIGQTMTVLIDEISEEGAIGRSYADAPEIDGVVVIEDGTDLVVGEFVTVEITDSGEHDLWGEVI
jgi:ribosomal protein S12 methylthiotransferase